MGGAPTGTITFLFTDIEGSTRSWETEPERMKEELARHDQVLRETIDRHDGYVFATGGDGFAVAFARAGAALACAADVQVALREAACPPVRIGVHTGEAEERDGDFFGPTVNRAARLMAIGHGGQVLVSAATKQVAGDSSLRDLGSHRLRDLSEPEHVFQLLIPGQQHDFPPLRSLSAATTNLPVQLTSLVGREQEIAAIRELLGEHRFVTLTGVGGVGKTRLALQTAADATEHFADGAWLVELAAVDAPRVVDTIARALAVPVRRDAAIEASLLEFVASRHLLLVLDNCEHLVRETRRVANELLLAAPELSILATSREGLRVAGEHLFPVPSLDDKAASQLFVERAQAADAAFTLDDTERRALEELCDRLDGVPLAIELAAARARMFRVGELTQRVEQRFRLLTGGRGDVERHQTLRAAIDWSYELLDTEERTALARISVFAGGGTLDAVEAVLAADDDGRFGIVDVLASLVDKSLVLVDRTHATTRYDMLETIRQYAQERLVESGDAEAVRLRHARFFADFARAAGRGLYSPDELVWDERMRNEVDNLLVAVTWAAGAGETDVAMRIGGSFTRQATSRPLLGSARLAEVALSVAGAETHPSYARVLAEAAWSVFGRGDITEAINLLDRSIAAQRAGARFSAAAFMYLLNLGSWHGTTVAERLELVVEGLRLAEASGDRTAEIGLRCAYASTLALGGMQEALATEHGQRALDDARALQQPTLEIAALFTLAQATFRSQPEAALRMLHESIELGRRFNTEAEEGAALGLLSYLEGRYGDTREALLALRARTIWETRNLGHFEGTWTLGPGVFSQVGRHDLVAFCEGKVARLSLNDGVMWEDVHQIEIAEARAALGEKAFDEIATRAAALSRDEFNETLLREIDAVLAQLDAR